MAQPQGPGEETGGKDESKATSGKAGDTRFNVDSGAIGISSARFG